ncbi:MAG TPA: fumarylacetoacetate hydrolase family protein [Gaiellaceae bacterium]|nr:fumarylacetoacetate hydrolase family protein [Gaiellaceae bacterium]
MRLASVVAGGERWAAVVEGDRAFDGSNPARAVGHDSGRGRGSRKSRAHHTGERRAPAVEYVSRYLTLLPGSVLATGTPGGTGWSQDPDLGGTQVTPAGSEPGRYLEAGDIVESEASA